MMTHRFWSSNAGLAVILACLIIGIMVGMVTGW